jgi:hypothetical protein
LANLTMPRRPRDQLFHQRNTFQRETLLELQAALLDTVCWKS